MKSIFLSEIVTTLKERRDNLRSQLLDVEEKISTIENLSTEFNVTIDSSDTTGKAKARRKYIGKYCTTCTKYKPARWIKEDTCTSCMGQTK